VICLRTNDVMRFFIDIVIGRVRDGSMTLDRAAELMIEHSTPIHVVSGVINRIQGAQ